MALSTALAAQTACGWHLGTAPGPALGSATVEGSTVEPGLRAALADGIERALRERGAPSGGPAVVLRITSMDETPEAAVPGLPQGTVAWTARLSLHAEVPSRPGCSVDVADRRTWTLPSDQPGDAQAARGQAVADLARAVATRAADALLALPECR